ncbi:hypothetical protein BJ875DRAFT_365668 [Amylocarpus encephaloides]|uniref:AGC-kinase C-terminal domain-containing protein n=1 Tax=Amylocarpus encephaloides TaxID=45428 RepID=A0A9P7YT69_9HELO|nr:hypothetical protein BJ875DRAFT_365668 [Amylocarpus encephaloides]
MFSYLRPHHRRTPSTPSSPADQNHSFEPHVHPVDHGHPQRWQETSSLDPSATINAPYMANPLTRITSGGSEAVSGSGDSPRSKASEREAWNQSGNTSKGTRQTGPMEGFSHNQQPRMPYALSQRPDSAGNKVPAHHSGSQHALSSPGTSNENTYRQKSPEPTYGFTAAGEYLGNGMPTGRRPTGARLPTPPSAPTNHVSTFEPPARSGKARLNLLNPMSLLARRRTSHAIPQLTPEALISSQGGQPENLDFRIRGTVVHDFSAPRPRRNVSYQDVWADEVPASSRPYQRSPNPDSNANDDNASGRWSGGNHTPVFTENFEETQYPAAGPHVRKADDLTDLPLPKPPYAKGAQRPLEFHATPNINDPPQDQIHAARRTSPRQSSAQLPMPDRAPPVPPKPQGSTQEKRISIDLSSTPPKSTPSNRSGRPRKVSEVSINGAVIPKQMKSTSSRFSFDMIGAAEQERLLEDRHRQRALEKKADRANDNENEEGFDDEYDFDDMDDDDGLEERIPGVNADLEDDEDEDFLEAMEEELKEYNPNLELPNIENLGGFSFQQSWLTPLSPNSPGMAETPRDADGEVIGFAMTKNSPYVPAPLAPRDSATSPSPLASPDAVPPVEQLQGLGLNGLSLRSKIEADVEPQFKGTIEYQSFPQPTGMDDDDLYFDDGIITGLGDDDEGDMEFDESVFDNIDTDEYGRPLKALSSIPTLYSPPTLTSDPSPSFNNQTKEPTETRRISDPNSIILPPTTTLAPQSSVQHIASQFMQQPSQGLTQDSLAAYQSALAAAAFNAAANGKFRRDSLPVNASPSEPEDTHPGLVTDSSRQTSHCEPFSPNYELEDDFDYDDALEDDAIIAAANAEALANDSDGFYGQEFGFYSAPAATETEYSNGGYFGPRGADGLNRAQSGRIVVREPNLTPITERSEYSNRNSFMSPMFGPPSSQSIASPGLAQLADMMSAQEYAAGDMSLNALLKLRRGAWGGSQASLHSSNGSPKSAGGPGDVSPVGSQPPWNQAPNPISYSSHGHRRKNSTISSVSEAVSGTGVQSEGSSAPGSPTLTMSTAALNTSKKDSSSENEETDKERPPLRRHKHSASAESISYLKEEDPVAGQRWILERRRTAESGEVELLEREVVQGGRI